MTLEPSPPPDSTPPVVPPDAPAGTAGSFRSRRARFVVLGILAIGIGAFCFLFTLLTALLATRPELLGIPRAATDQAGLRSVLPAASIYALLGAAFIACGIGSIQARRWVRPIMLTISWTWLAAGALSVILLIVAGRDTLLGGAGGDEDLPPGVGRVVWLITLGLVVFIEVLLPIVFIWGYRPKDVQRTAEARHPAPSWTDRAPSQVLGLAIALAAGAVLPIPFAFHTVFPVFGGLVTGTAATLLTLVVSALLGALAWGCYRRRMEAWWGVFALTLILGASTAVTWLAITPEQVVQGWGLTPEQGRSLRESGLLGSPWIAGCVLLITLTCAVYLVAIRKYFRAPATAA